MKLFYKLTVFVLSAISYTSMAFAQYNLPQNKVWVMGDGIGLDFNGPGDPVAIQTNIQSSQHMNCASVADNSGQLLFYSNGNTVWTASGTIMPNGDSLKGGVVTLNQNANGQAPYTINHNCQIIPAIGTESAGKYYFFTLKWLGVNALHTQLYCNLIDMSLNNGQGDVDTTFPLRSVMIADSIAGKITTIRNCNNEIWLIVHMAYSPVFKAYKISASGIDTVPVISDLSGQMPPLYNGGNLITTPRYDLYGSMKASPDGSHIAVCNWSIPSYCLSLYHFNSSTGQVSNPVAYMLNTTASVRDVAFSPSGNQIYVNSTWPMPYSLLQFSVSQSPEYDSVYLGKRILSTDLRLGPDGKIYFGGGGIWNHTTGEFYFHSIGRINYPDSLGLACGFQDSIASIDFLSLSTPGRLFHGLPNEIVVAQSGALGLSISFSQDTLFASPDNYSAYQWYHGDTLLTGATNAYLTITTGGWYSVKVTADAGCTDSVAFDATKYMDTTTGIGPLSQLKNNIQIYPNPTSRFIIVKAPVKLHLNLYNIQGELLLQNAADNRLDLSSFANGLYFLRIENNEGRLIKMVKVSKLE